MEVDPSTSVPLKRSREEGAKESTPSGTGAERSKKKKKKGNKE
jgi:hypothetical protein